MFKLIAPRDLEPVPAIAGAAFVALAVFAWTERTVLVDPDGMSVPYWPWKLWQVVPLLIGFGGVWWVWLSTRRAPWVRSLALGVLALVVLANAYSGLFGDYRGDVWRTVNPLFIGSSSVAAVALWRAGHAAGRAGAVVSAALGVSALRQCVLCQQQRCLAGTGPGANACEPGLGRRRQPGQCRHTRRPIGV